MWLRRVSVGIIAGLTISCQEAEERNTPYQLARQEAAHASALSWAARLPRPPEQIVERIEALLAQQPCIGGLERWSRSYSYHYDPVTGSLYNQIVDVSLEEASADAPAGRQVTGPISWMTIDDRPIMMARADYDVVEDRLRVQWCGNNGRSMSRSDDERFEAYFDDLERRRASLTPVRVREFPPGQER